MPCKSPILHLQKPASPCALTQDSKFNSVAQDEIKKFVFIPLTWEYKKVGGLFFRRHRLYLGGKGLTW